MEVQKCRRNKITSYAPPPPPTADLAWVLRVADSVLGLLDASGIGSDFDKVVVAWFAGSAIWLATKHKSANLLERENMKQSIYVTCFFLDHAHYM